MVKEDIVNILKFFFSDSTKEKASFIQELDGQRIIERILKMEDDPICVTHANQLLHLNHEAGVTEGFFKYYFLDKPFKHPYSIDKVLDELPKIDTRGMSSLRQLELGLKRFFVDSLLFFGNIRSAYRELRVKSYSELEELFQLKCYDLEKMSRRSHVMPFVSIPVDDRYLISEIACKAFSSMKVGDPILIEKMLIDAYTNLKKRSSKRVRIASLFDDSTPLAKDDPPGQMMLQFATEEIMDVMVENEEEISKNIKPIADRFDKARKSAIENTRLYLSIVNEMDIYVATSMRKRTDFRNMAKDCEYIFKREGLRTLNIRYFDPTMSAADRHEDKGLIECLMVKCAKVILYFAGDSDSFGKDAEVAMAMSLGKPAIILCPDTDKGKQRLKFFRDIHPLSRLVHFDTGVVVGAMVTQNKDVASKLMERIFNNCMEYDLEHTGDGYFRLRERLTKSVVRLQTNSRILRESFWNYYHGVS